MQKMRDDIRTSNAGSPSVHRGVRQLEYAICGKGYLNGINDHGNIVLNARCEVPAYRLDSKDSRRPRLPPRSRARSCNEGRTCLFSRFAGSSR
jgi:hypothetical protein